MSKRFFLAWVVTFVAWMMLSFVVHGVLLHDEYARLPNLFRPEAEAQTHFPLMLLAHVLMAGGLRLDLFDGVTVVILGILVAFQHGRPARA